VARWARGHEDRPLISAGARGETAARRGTGMGQGVRHGLRRSRRRTDASRPDVPSLHGQKGHPCGDRPSVAAGPSTYAWRSRILPL